MFKKILLLLAAIFIGIPAVLIAGLYLLPSEEPTEDWRHNITGKSEVTAPKPRPRHVEDKPKTRQEQIESMFSQYDGSFRPLERIVQNNMNDPDSYEHVETKYVDKDDHIIVVMKYRGNNAFGGKVLETIGARYYLDTNQIEVVTE